MLGALVFLFLVSFMVGTLVYEVQVKKDMKKLFESVMKEREERDAEETLS